MMEEIFVDVPFLREDFLKHVRDVVGTDYATITPDLDHVWIIDHPAVFFICLIDNVDPLHKGAQEGNIYSFAQVFKESVLLCCRSSPFGKGKVPFKGCRDPFAITPESRSESNII